jgi:two-component system response regulator AlgR
MNRRVLIVDDEPLARSRLLRLLEGIEGYEPCGEADSGQSAVDQASRLAADIVLMDIRMPGMDGLEAATRLASLPTPPAVIFCTAYDEYALPAFAASAIGYLLKPVRREQLLAALQRALKLNQAQLRALHPPTPDPAQKAHMSTRSQRGVELIPLADIRCLLADQKYVTVVYSGGEQLVDKSLKELEQEHPELWVRAHRNALVAVAWIEALEREPGGQYFVRLTGTHHRPQVSRRHLARLRDLVEQL